MPREDSETKLTDFKNQLHKKISRYFNLNEIGDLVFLLGIEFHISSSEPISANVRQLINFCERRNLLPNLLEGVKSARLNVTWPEWPGERHIDHFPFTNRDSEIQHIISSSNPYRIIEAPIGYGKTALLEELGKRFDSTSWRSAYIQAADNLKLRDEVAPLLNEIYNNSQIQGIVILLDMHQIPDEALFSNLLKQTIEVHNYLESNTNYFAQRPGGFRVIFAGRHLSTFQEKVEINLPLAITGLSTFDFNVIYRSAKEYLSPRHNISDLANQQLAAHLLHLTGGHPGCMSQIIRIYSKTNLTGVDQFISNNRQNILNNIVLPVINKIRTELSVTFSNNGIPQFIKANTLRYFIYPVLEKFIDLYQIENSANVVEFDYQLTASKLFERDLNTNFLQDGVIRRLNTIHLWYLNPDEYPDICLNARQICHDYLREQDCQLPVLWAVESLFQYLLAHANRIATSDERNNLKATFFAEIVPETISALTSFQQHRTEFLRRNLENFLQGDWELKFLVNYYLRKPNNQYTNEPSNELLSLIRSSELLN